MGLNPEAKSAIKAAFILMATINLANQKALLVPPDV